MQEPPGATVAKTDYPAGAVPAASSAILASSTGQPALAAEKAPGDYLYGPNVLMLTNPIPETRNVLERLTTFFPSGYSTIIPHDVGEMQIPTVKGIMTLIRRTGVEQTASSASKLTTIFELWDDHAPVFPAPKGSEPLGVGDKVR